MKKVLVILTLSTSAMAMNKKEEDVLRMLSKMPVPVLRVCAETVEASHRRQDIARWQRSLNDSCRIEGHRSSLLFYLIESRDSDECHFWNGLEMVDADTYKQIKAKAEAIVRCLKQEYEKRREDSSPDLWDEMSKKEYHQYYERLMAIKV